MKRSLSFILVLCLLISMIFTGCSSDTNQQGGNASDKGVVLKLSTATAESSSRAVAAKKFGEIVSEKTNGKVKVEVYPNDQLSGGNQGKGIEMLMAGSVDMGFWSNIIYSIMDERFSAISLPFLIPDSETVDKVLDGEAGEAINKLLLEKNIIGLGFGEGGFRQITNNKLPIHTVEDMKGLKIRVPGMKMYISLYKALGSDPITMNFGEVFTALQQKTIDGQENPADVIESAKLYEVQKYMTIWDYSYDALFLGINKDKFESFDSETQQILRDAAKEACQYQRELDRERTKEYIQKFIDAGVEVNELTAEEKAKFKEAVQPVYDEYEPIIGKETMDLFR